MQHVFQTTFFLTPEVSNLAARILAAHSLAAESVEGATLTLQGIDDIHGGDSLALGMFGVSDCVSAAESNRT